MKHGCRGHRIEGVDPHIGADGRILIKDDIGFGSHRIAGLNIGFGGYVEADIPLAVC